MRGKCKHENATGFMWRSHKLGNSLIQQWAYAFVQPGRVDHHHRVTCDDCHAWLPLGPARDDGEFAEAVAVEVRAAELTVQRKELNTARWAHYLHQDGAEHAGWIEHAFDSAKVPEQPGEWSGYLARCITTHTEQREASDE